MASLFKHIFNGSKPENGELTINLNLTIKIEADGTLSVAPTAEKTDHSKPIIPLKKQEENKESYVNDFDFGFGDENENGIISFGKNV
jgi:flagellar basal body rod protein FlgF